MRRARLSRIAASTRDHDQLAAGLLVAVFALSGRRMLREPLSFSLQEFDGGDGLQEGEVVG
jgi:hypothetical protein